MNFGIAGLVLLLRLLLTALLWIWQQRDDKVRVRETIGKILGFMQRECYVEQNRGDLLDSQIKHDSPKLLRDVMLAHLRIQVLALLVNVGVAF